MIEGNQFVETAKQYFNLLIAEFDFNIYQKKIKGNTFYDVQYSDKTWMVSVSYENIEDYLQVIVFMLQNGELPDYDDKTKTLYLNHLNALVLNTLDKGEINLNNAWFTKFSNRMN